jgi:hypothetical protein
MRDRDIARSAFLQQEFGRRTLDSAWKRARILPSNSTFAIETIVMPW